MEPPEERALIDRAVSCLRRKRCTVYTDWEVVRGKTQFGVGDVMGIRNQEILVVECKFVNRTNATKKRKKVRDQALLYASFAKTQHPTKRVRGCWYTNESVGYTGFLTYEDAMGNVAAFLERAGLLRSVCEANREKLLKYLKTEYV